jgi:hypothetical protein
VPEGDTLLKFFKIFSISKYFKLQRNIREYCVIYSRGSRDGMKGSSSMQSILLSSENPGNAYVGTSGADTRAQQSSAAY